MVFTIKPTFLPWSLLDYLSLLDTLSDHVFMYVGLFGHSAVVFHVIMFFLHVFMFYWPFMWLCFFQWHFIDLSSCIAASLFNKLTYLLMCTWCITLSPMTLTDVSTLRCSVSTHKRQHRSSNCQSTIIITSGRHCIHIAPIAHFVCT